MDLIDFIFSSKEIEELEKVYDDSQLDFLERSEESEGIFCIDYTEEDVKEKATEILKLKGIDIKDFQKDFIFKSLEHLMFNN